MKKMMQLACGALLIAALTTIQSCKKAETGPKGDTGASGTQGPAGPSAKTYTFTETFGPSTQTAYYNGIIGDFDKDDMVQVYVYNSLYAGEPQYVQTPYIAAGFVNFYVEVGESSGALIIHTDKASGATGSPWTSTVAFTFKAILIKSAQIKLHPDIRTKSYTEVVQTLGLKD